MGSDRLECLRYMDGVIGLAVRDICPIVKNRACEPPRSERCYEAGLTGACGQAGKTFLRFHVFSLSIFDSSTHPRICIFPGLFPGCSVHIR